MEPENKVDFIIYGLVGFVVLVIIAGIILHRYFKKSLDRERFKK